MFHTCWIGYKSGERANESLKNFKMSLFTRGISNHLCEEIKFRVSEQNKKKEKKESQWEWIYKITNENGPKRIKKTKE